MKFIVSILLALGVSSAFAVQQPQPFQRGSFQKIISAHEGKPFIVAMWSLSCTHCSANMEIFEKLVKKYVDFNLVLISTDTLEQKALIVSTLNKYLLGTVPMQKFSGKVASWVFADSHSERLRYEIDPQWYGELPRTYFFDVTGKSRGVSGVLDEKETELWLRAQR